MDKELGRWVRAVAGVCAAVLVIGVPVAWGDPDETDGSETPGLETFDDLFSRVGEAAPAFAGAWVDEGSDTLLLGLTDTSTTAALEARKALADVFGPVAYPQANMQAVQAEFSFAELRAWYEPLARAVLAEEGVVQSDIDEVRNRIAIGVEDPVLHGPAVERHIAEQGVPREAVVIEQSGPIVPGSTLRDKHRPVRGGLRIRYRRAPGDWRNCTLGVVARRVSTGNLGIITASHCSSDFGGGADDTPYRQAAGSSNHIADETVDPGFFTGGSCPVGLRCRYSDANFARLVERSIGQPRGYLARPGSGVNWNGTRKYTIVGRSIPSVGMTVKKVGQVTGRTTGEVTGTCVNGAVEGTNITLLCLTRASYFSDAGDSGAPVFISDAVGQYDVLIAGIHHGNLFENGVRNNEVSYYSKFYNVEYEVGQMKICPSGYGC